MNDLVQPDWAKNHTPLPNPGNPNWKKGGPSPNPRGRLPGKTATQKVQAALNDGSLAVAQVALDAALAGDMQAVGIVLARVSPTLRSQSQTVQFEFDPSLPIARQVEQVLAAVAAGQVAPDIGQTIIAAIGTLSTVRANEELEQRIIQLEAKAI
jgi:hypothetical protein